LSEAANVMSLEIPEIVDYMGCLIGLQPIYIQQLVLYGKIIYVRSTKECMMISTNAFHGFLNEIRAVC
jgi:hypothetical protein